MWSIIYIIIASFIFFFLHNNCLDIKYQLFLMRQCSVRWHTEQVCISLINVCNSYTVVETKFKLIKYFKVWSKYNQSMVSHINIMKLGFTKECFIQEIATARPLQADHSNDFYIYVLPFCEWIFLVSKSYLNNLSILFFNIFRDFELL